MLRRYLFGLIPLSFIKLNTNQILSKEGEICWTRLLKEYNHVKQHWNKNKIYLHTAIHYQKDITGVSGEYTRIYIGVIDPYKNNKDVSLLYCGQVGDHNFCLTKNEVKEIEKRFEQLQ